MGAGRCERCVSSLEHAGRVDALSSSMSVSSETIKFVFDWEISRRLGDFIGACPTWHYRRQLASEASQAAEPIEMVQYAAGNCTLSCCKPYKSTIVCEYKKWFS